jgi:hypothetical protein
MRSPKSPNSESTSRSASNGNVILMNEGCLSDSGRDECEEPPAYP